MNARGHHRRSVWIAGVLATFVLACAPEEVRRGGSTSGGVAPAALADASEPASHATDAEAPGPRALADAGADGGGAESEQLPGTTEGCPDDMVRVKGSYCPGLDQVCLEHHFEY